MRARSRTVEEICAALAARSHGVVSLAELRAAGIGRGQIERRRARGYLIVEFPGVYRVGHAAPSIEARYMAAVKACGEGAVLSGPAAAHLYGLIRGAEPIPHVTAPRERRVRGVRTKRSREVERALYRGIPITTVARTLVDLASTLPLTDLGRACREAGVKYGTTPGQVEEVLQTRPTTAGAAKLRAVVRGETPITQSALERHFLALLAENDLPEPIVNKPAGSFRVDCRWPEARLTVELDSYRFHNSRHAWEQDRRREREARARGDDFRRYTYGDVCEQPHQMLRELRPLVRKRAA
jgi:hypothetical protein